MNKDQLRAIIREVLEHIGLYSESAEELLMLTAAVESNLGQYVRQIGGPAKGIFQMEPATENDIWENYLDYKTGRLKLAVSDFEVLSGDSLVHSLGYQIAMARVHYLRVAEQLPESTDIVGLARYWKKYYNTELGSGTIEKAIGKYNRYVANEVS